MLFLDSKRVLIASCLLAICCISPATAIDRQRAKDKKILADSATTFPMDGNLVLRGFSNRKQIARPAAVTHAIVMIHGVLRDPDYYFLPAMRMLEQKSLSGKVALVAPGFDDRDSAPKNVQRLALFGRSWKHGAFGGLNPDDPKNKLSAFRVIDRILVDLKKTYPQLQKITLIGHSAGAQFLDRYSVLSSIGAELPGVALRFVVLAPSTVLYPSKLRPEVDRKGRLSFAIPVDTCDGEYNEYPYGLNPSALFLRLVAHPAAERARLANNLLTRKVVFAVGDEDTATNYLDESCAANTQGPNRYTRLKYFVEYLKTKYHATSPRFLPIAGAGHGAHELIQSREMSEFFAER